MFGPLRYLGDLDGVLGSELVEKASDIWVLRQFQEVVRGADYFAVVSVSSAARPLVFVPILLARVR